MASDEASLFSSIKIDIQYKKWIKPVNPTPPHLHNYQLSSIDQLQPPYFVPLVYHFDFGNENAQTPLEKRLARLEESLSEVLTLYYPFAGKYDASESRISCADQGVEFVVANVDRKLDELADGDYDKEAFVSGVERIGWAWDVACSPVFSIQVNVLRCGGIAIGLSFLHKVSDMFTFSTFMDAWSTVCRLGTLDQVIHPNFGLSSLLPPIDFSKQPPSETNTEMQQPPSKFVSKRYIFTGEAISKLKSIINKFAESESEINMTRHTRVELVTALITRCFINIECSKCEKPRPLVISQPMNMRSKTALPIEENSIGNLCIKITSTVDVVEKESWELRELAGIIRNSIGNIASEIKDVHDWSEIKKKVENAYMEYEQETRKGDDEVNLVRFSSWCRFGLYDVDFGWGKPSLVTTVASPFVIAHLMDHDASDGIEAWVCLKEDDMARFQQESDILEYAC